MLTQGQSHGTNTLLQRTTNPDTWSNISKEPKAFKDVRGSTPNWAREETCSPKRQSHGTNTLLQIQIPVQVPKHITASIQTSNRTQCITQVFKGREQEAGAQWNFPTTWRSLSYRICKLHVVKSENLWSLGQQSTILIIEQVIEYL